VQQRANANAQLNTSPRVWPLSDNGFHRATIAKGNIRQAEVGLSAPHSSRRVNFATSMTTLEGEPA
jgi:hypothetical protein